MVNVLAGALNISEQAIFNTDGAIKVNRVAVARVKFLMIPSDRIKIFDSKMKQVIILSNSPV
jgi:hypothetical protein